MISHQIHYTVTLISCLMVPRIISDFEKLDKIQSVFTNTDLFVPIQVGHGFRHPNFECVWTSQHSVLKLTIYYLFWAKPEMILGTIKPENRVTV